MSRPHRSLRYLATAPFVLLALIPIAAARDDPPENADGGKAQPARGAVAGIVVDAETGQPVPHVRIGIASAEAGLGIDSEGQLTTYNEFVYDDDGKDLGRNAVIARADRHGRFRFENLAAPEKPHMLIAVSRSNGCALLRDVVPSKLGTEPLRVPLRPSASVAITVSRTMAPPGMTTHTWLELQPPVTGKDDDGNPTYGDSVWLWLHSESDGRRTHFPVVPAGLAYRLQVGGTTRTLPYFGTLYEELITPEAGEKIDRFAKEGPSGAKLSGRITGEDGKGMATINVLVELGGADRKQVFGTFTDDEGRYEFAALPAGKHSLALKRHRARTVPG